MLRLAILDKNIFKSQNVIWHFDKEILSILTQETIDIEIILLNDTNNQLTYS